MRQRSYSSKTLASKTLVCGWLVCLALAQTGCAGPSLGAPNADGEVVPPDEAALTRQIVADIQQNVRATFAKEGRAYRDVHRKSHGCVHATFTVLGHLPAPLAQGLFAQPQSHRAVLRFSNGSPHAQDDHDRDARGMALKVLDVPGPKVLSDDPETSTQDFLMTNHPVFFIRDARGFAGFQKATDSGGLRLVGWVLGHAFHETPLLLSFTGHDVRNPLASRYWSTTPSRLGTGQMKFAARPCAGSQPVETSDTANRLGDNLRAQLATGSACFDFQVQLRTVPAAMPIEDATIAWSEALSPFVTVARIDVPAQVPEDPAVCEARAFTPWHTLPAHQPLGGISRVRKVVYEAVSRLRHELNQPPQPPL